MRPRATRAATSVADIALDRRERLRQTQLQIEVTMVQRANRDADGRAVVFASSRTQTRS